MIKIFLALNLALYSCIANSEVNQAAKNITTIQSSNGNYYLSFSPSDENMPLNEYFDLDIDIRGSTHQKLKYPLKLAIDVGMKAHNHGMNVQPIIEDKGHGQFKIKGMLLHMPGKWFIQFKISRGMLSDMAEKELFIGY